MTDLSGDLHAGHYAATSTVQTGRRNLFSLEPGHERHIGTLISGSTSGIDRFDKDCDSIVRGLALVEIVDDILQALTLAEKQIAPIQHAQHRQGVTIIDTDAAMRAVTTALETVRGVAHGRS